MEIISLTVNFAIQLIVISIGFSILGASAYGIGKYENKKDSPEYRASLAFLIIGMMISVSSIIYWHQGNLITQYCSEAIREFGKPHAQNLQ